MIWTYVTLSSIIFVFFQVSPYKTLAIAGGEDANITDYPFMVSLIYEYEYENETLEYLFCGGALISDSWILTSAYCTTSFFISNFSVLAGSAIVYQGQQLSVEKIITHENYSFIYDVEPDIALIELSEPVICDNCNAIPLGSRPNTSDLITILGWGVNNSENETIILQAVDVPVIDQDQCKGIYSGSNRQVTDNNFCAGYLDIGVKGYCDGDQGGPALVDNQLVGLISWGIDCGSPSYPGVYTNIESYLHWIEENTKLKF